MASCGSGVKLKDEKDVGWL
ncbi:UNVERIFIED_CONTAM: hypothetical protein GTU68_025559 [Idotea baltica]|nr:hypothetical protein [Idotea baltica]